MGRVGAGLGRSRLGIADRFAVRCEGGCGRLASLETCCGCLRQCIGPWHRRRNMPGTSRAYSARKRHEPGVRRC